MTNRNYANRGRLYIYSPILCQAVFGGFMKKIQGIYKITNNINNHCYIGSSVDIYKRWREHRARSEINTEWYQNTYYNHLYCAFRKYGRDNFTYIILEEVKNVADLLVREQYWYDYYSPSYNKMRPDRSPICAGLKHSDETKEKISRHNAKYWLGKNLSQDMINNIVAGNKNKRKSVIMIDKDTNQNIREFDGMCNALRFLDKNPNSSHGIKMCCEGRALTAYGYKWAYTKTEG